MENSTLAKVCQAAKAARLYALKLVNISLDNILRAFYLRENASPQLYLKRFCISLGEPAQKHPERKWSPGQSCKTMSIWRCEIWRALERAFEQSVTIFNFAFVVQVSEVEKILSLRPNSKACLIKISYFQLLRGPVYCRLYTIYFNARWNSC